MRNFYIYWLSSDKGSISALRLTRLIGISWLTAQRMLRKFRIVMGDQNSLYKLTGTIELDDAFVGGKRAGKRGRGAEGKTAILVACEHNDGKPGFVAMKAVSNVNKENVRKFAKESIESGQILNTHVFCALKVLTEEHYYVAQVTPPELVDEWLPWVHLSWLSQAFHQPMYIFLFNGIFDE